MTNLFSYVFLIYLSTGIAMIRSAGFVRVLEGEQAVRVIEGTQAVQVLEVEKIVQVLEGCRLFRC